MKHQVILILKDNDYPVIYADNQNDFKTLAKEYFGVALEFGNPDDVLYYLEMEGSYYTKGHNFEYTSIFTNEIYC